MAELNETLLTQLQDLLGATGLIADEVTGEGWIMRPADTQELARALKLCNDAGQSVIPIGGRTGLAQALNKLGNEIGLSTERLRAIEEIDEASRTMTVQAGVPLQTIQEAAEAKGMIFPLDLGARGTATIGGNISTNAGGNRVLRWGMTRDMVIAVEAVLADGTILPMQGKALKNNTGYDLKHLLIGGEGTLGVVTRAILRLRPKPTSENCAIVATSDFESVPKLLSYLERQCAGSLSSYEVLWPDYYNFITGDMNDHEPPLARDYAYYILVETMGAHPDKDKRDFEEMLQGAFEEELIVDAVLAQSSTDRDKFWAIRDDVLQLFQLGQLMLFDISVAIQDMEDYTNEVGAKLQERFGDHHFMVFGHLGDGNIHLNIGVGDLNRDKVHAVDEIVFNAVRDRNGSISAEHGVGTMKKDYLHFTRSEDEIALMRRVKLAFDPNNILNPGKIFDVT